MSSYPPGLSNRISSCVKSTLIFARFVPWNNKASPWRFEVIKDNSFFVNFSFNSFEIPCASVSSSPKNTFVKLFPIIALPILSVAFNTSSICWVDTVQSALYFLKRLYAWKKKSALILFLSKK